MKKRPFEKVAADAREEYLECFRTHDANCAPIFHIEQAITREVNRAIRKAARIGFGFDERAYREILALQIKEPTK